MMAVQATSCPWKRRRQQEQELLCQTSPEGRLRGRKRTPLVNRLSLGGLHVILLLLFLVHPTMPSGKVGERVPVPGEELLETRSPSKNTRPDVTVVPAFLNFKKRPTCIAQRETVTLTNKESVSELHIFSVSSNSANFHAADFKKFTLEPLESGTFTVIFLPRTVGVVHDTLVIETSLGGFIYPVQGEGRPNPYRATALLDVKIPVGVNYKPSFELYNPHSKELRIKEIYTNQGFLHLVLPSSSSHLFQKRGGAGGAGEDAGLWVVPPHRSSHIINLSFTSGTPGKHSGFIHVRTDADDLVIPVDLSVLKGGLHLIPDDLKIDTLVTPGQKEDVSMSLLNASPHPVLILDVMPIQPADPQLNITFRKGTVIPPGAEHVIATASYTGMREGVFVGKVQVVTNSTEQPQLEVPYLARVLFGSIQTSSQNTTFIIGSLPLEPIEKHVTIANRFAHPLLLTSATIEDPNFDVVNFIPETVVPVGARSRPIAIRFLPQSPTMLFSTTLKLSTNVTTLHVAIQCYHGRIILQDPNGIDAGLVSVKASVERFFNLSNPNPIKVPILAINSSVPGVELSLVSISGPKGELSHHDIKALLAAGAKGAKGKTAALWQVPASSTAQFRVAILSPTEQDILGDITFATEHEPVVVPVRYRSLEGSLEVEPLATFDPSFPGRVAVQPIHATSTYRFPLKLTSMSASDVRFCPSLINSNSTLLPGVRTQIGRIVFDPSKGPAEGSYMEDHHPWQSMAGEGSAWQRDVERMERLDEAWQQLQARKGHLVEASVSITTDISVAASLPARGSLTRPVLFPQGNTLSFPLTQVGSPAMEHVPFHNPSDHPMLVQLLPPPQEVHAHTYKDVAASSRCTSTRACVASSTFLLPDKMIKRGIVIPPHTHTTLGPIFFVPKEEGLFSATLYLRNNLTLMHPLRVRGEGGSGSLHFTHEGSQCKGLMFVVTKDMLGQDGRASAAARAPRTLTKSFSLVNSGTIRVTIVSLSFKGAPKGACAWRNFKLGPLRPN